jgi:hypothetical protein
VKTMRTRHQQILDFKGFSMHGISVAKEDRVNCRTLCSVVKERINQTKLEETTR